MKHFDKMLLTVLILIFALCAFRGFQVGSVGLETFGSDTTKLFAGALLMLITGENLKKNSDEKKLTATAETKDGETK
jgi:hypothetical protein